jgi:hypothetical protein
LSTKADQLEWRRANVVEMRARGLSLGEIARELQVSRASSDMQYLRDQAKEYIREHVKKSRTIPGLSYLTLNYITQNGNAFIYFVTVHCSKTWPSFDFAYTSTYVPLTTKM